MSDSNDRAAGHTVIGGKHGSPSVTIALPFSKITSVDSELRDAVGELASLVARLAAVSSPGNDDEVALVRTAAQELADRLAEPRG
jgi:hypothetical protein